MTTSPSNALVRALKVGDSSLRDALVGSCQAHAARTVSDYDIDLTNADMLCLMRGLIDRSSATGPTAVAAKNRLSAGSRGVFDLVEHFAGLDLATYVPFVPYPNGVLGNHLRETAMLIKAGLDIEMFWVDTGGWDQHSGEPGFIAIRAAKLSQALDAFVADLGTTLMNDVCVLVMSEFGRAADENGPLGTADAKGGVAFCVGGAVHGIWPGVGPIV